MLTKNIKVPQLVNGMVGFVKSFTKDEGIVVIFKNKKGEEFTHTVYKKT